MPRSDSPSASDSLKRVRELEAQIEALRLENQDLNQVLRTTTEHGDLIEAILSDTNLKLKAEIAERQRMQLKLQSLLELINRQKADLEIMMETVTQHGDVIDVQWREQMGAAVELANLDPLTQCSNRRRFDSYLGEQWQFHSQNQQSIALILCDIDYFKAFNDFYGHLSGDDCLRRVAQVMSASLRQPRDLLCRYGGEEFVAILPGATLQGAVLSARRMQASVAGLDVPHHPSLISERVTVSFGVAAMVPPAGSQAETLIAEADRCLYRAKAEGRNTIACPLHPDSDVS